MNPAPKLYSFVTVKQDGFAHVGEVLSLPTPDNTLMVRMVPGDETTLREVPIAQLAPVINRPRYVHYATVRGGRRFPVDMLRYENAAPANFTIESNGVFDVAVPTVPDDRLIVAYASDEAQPQWTSARWRSFGWAIKHVHSMKIEKH